MILIRYGILWGHFGFKLKIINISEICVKYLSFVSLLVQVKKGECGRDERTLTIWNWNALVIFP